MRKELELIQKIEQYLQGQLNLDETLAFEQQLNINAELKQEVDLQLQLNKGLERIAIKASASKAYQNYKFKTNLYKWGFGSLSVLVLSLAIVYGSMKLSENNQEHQTINNQPENDGQVFEFNPNRDTFLQTMNGNIISIPAHSFDDEKNQFSKNSVILNIPKSSVNDSLNNTLCAYINSINQNEDSIASKNQTKNPINVYTLHFYSPHIIDSLKKVGYQIKHKNSSSALKALFNAVNPRNYKAKTYHESVMTENDSVLKNNNDTKHQKDSISAKVLGLNVSKLKTDVKNRYDKITSRLGRTIKNDTTTNFTQQKTILVFDINNKNQNKSGIDSTSAKILSNDLKNKAIISKKQKSK